MKPKKITSQSFRPYGKIIHYPNKSSKGSKRNLWRIVHNEPQKTGWRIAYLILRDKTLGRLECHPDSDESFEPVKGRCLFFVSKTKDFHRVDCFVLDKPIVLYKGIYHGLIVLGRECEIKLVENVKVKCLYWKFPQRIISLEEIRQFSA